MAISDKDLERLREAEQTMQHTSQLLVVVKSNRDFCDMPNSVSDVGVS